MSDMNGLDPCSRDICQEIEYRQAKGKCKYLNDDSQIILNFLFFWVAASGRTQNTNLCSLVG